METAIVLFTRDLRVRDNPALSLACARARQVVPLFVVDPALKVPPNRARFLAESIAVLRGELRNCGGDLVTRPIRQSSKLAKNPPSQVRVFKPQDCGQLAGADDRAFHPPTSLSPSRSPR